MPVREGGRRTHRNLGALAMALLGLVAALAACSLTPSLSGTITDPNTGNPAAGVAVAVYSDASETLLRTTYTNASGHYDVFGLDAGTYRLRMADAAWYQRAESWEAATPVVVVADTTTTVDAAVVPGVGGLSGMAAISGGGSPNGVTVAAINAVTSQIIATTTTNGSGAYSFPTLASGPYKVRFSRTGLGSVYSGGAVGASSAPVSTVSTGGSVTGVNATLTTEARITGTASNGADGVGGLVMLAKTYPGGEVITTAPTAPDGSFTLSGLPAASYHVMVLDINGSYRQEMLGTTHANPTGTVITVANGASTDLGTQRVVGVDCDPTVLYPSAPLAGTIHDGDKLMGCDFTGANLSAASFVNANLTGALLTQTNVTGATLTGATIHGARLNIVTGINSTTGLVSTVANSWSHTDFFASLPNLQGVNLSGADLSYTNFANFNWLVGANFKGANLSNTNLTGAVLWGANLHHTNVAGADFDDASLPGAVGSPIGFSSASYIGTACPSWVLSSTNGNTCAQRPWLCEAPTCLPANRCPNAEVQPWWGAADRQSVTFPGQIETVAGTIFKPTDTVTYPGPRPVVILIYGYDSNECYQWWAAWSLAARGYTTLAFTPTYPSTSGGDTRAAITFMSSPTNPYASVIDAGKVGLAGYSSGATVALDLQEDDLRVDAVVALDNLTRLTFGDPSAPGNCTNSTGASVYTARVPAMGLASDKPCDTDPTNWAPDLKIHGFNHWRASGQPTSVLVVAGTTHQSFDMMGAIDAHREYSVYAMAAWFDRWLVGDPTAMARISAASWNGVPRSTILSPNFISATSTPEYTCLDMWSC